MKTMHTLTKMSAVAVALLGVLGGADSFAQQPKNIILMISDGAGYQHFDAGSLFQYGATGTQVYDAFPAKFAVTTWDTTTQKKYADAGKPGPYDSASAWSDFNYVKFGATDSASAATAMATGVKTDDGNLAWLPGDPANGQLKTIVETASDFGKATGVVTSVEFSHATPAGFAAHNVSRNNYAQIANEMIYNSDLDVIMGAGNPDFDDNGNPAVKNAQYVGGSTTWADLKDADGAQGLEGPWSLIQTKAEFEALAAGGATPDRVIGVAQAYTTLQQSRSGNGDVLGVPFNAGVPSLTTMSLAAINVLDNDADGFFLMIEGGAVDWAGHANQDARVVEEQIDFNDAVNAVVNWIETAGGGWTENLLLITADHETGGLWGPGAGPVANFNPLVNNGIGNLPGMSWASGSHTNSLVPLFAKGAGSVLLSQFVIGSDQVRGEMVDNTAIYHVMRESVVPEPSAIVLLGVGAVALGLAGVRRRLRSQ